MWNATIARSFPQIIRDLSRITHLHPPPLVRTITTTAHLSAKPLPPRPKINEADITENFLKGSGPGGQKINKTNSAVQLLHAPTGLVLKCQATRSRTQNRKIARQLLAEKLEEREKGEKGEMCRGQIKAERERKKKASKLKKSRRKYRALEEGKVVGEEGDGEEEEEEEEEEEKEKEKEKGETEVALEEKEEPQPTGVEQELPEWEKKWRELRGIK